MDKRPPSQNPYLHIRSIEGLLFADAIAITGNARALLQLRAQIDRTLADEGEYPFEESVYQDVHGQPFEVVIEQARSREEMEEPGPKPGKTAEKMPWSERPRESEDG